MRAPNKVAHMAETVREEGASAREAPSNCMGNINVLIVEDDEYQQSVLRVLFEKANEINDGIVYLSATMVATGGEAMALINDSESFDFSVVLLDLKLPGEFDGIQILQRIRALPDGDKIGVVIASAFANVGLVARCMQLGADAYLQKPILLQSIKLIWQ